MVMVLLGSDIAGCGYENSSGLNRAESIEKTDTENLVREKAVEETISLENEIEKNVETIIGDVNEDTEWNGFDEYLIDMAAMVEIMKKGGEISGCELRDVNQDGYKELCIEKIDEDTTYLTQYVIGAWNNPGMCLNTDMSAAGSTDMLLSENQVYLKQYYVTADWHSETTWLYEDNTWKEIEDIPNSDTLRTLNNDCDDITRVSIVGSMDNVCNALENFWDKSGRNFCRTSYDMNGDGTEDVVYAIEDYFREWKNNINSAYADNSVLMTLPKDSILVSLFQNNQNVEVRIDVGNALLPDLLQSGQKMATLSRYLSHFSEYELQNYNILQRDYHNLLEYTYEICVNEMAGEKVKFRNSYNAISKDDIDEILETYFGVSAPAETVGDIEYVEDENEFHFPPTPGGLYGTNIAVVDTIREKEREKYEITFYPVFVRDVDYEIGEINYRIADMDTYYSYTMADVIEDKFCEVLGKISCTIKWMDNRFIIQEYRHLD